MLYPLSYRGRADATDYSVTLRRPRFTISPW